MSWYSPKEECVKKIILGRRKQAYIDSLKKKGRKAGSMCGVVIESPTQVGHMIALSYVERLGEEKMGFLPKRNGGITHYRGTLHMFQRTVVDNQKSG